MFSLPVALLLYCYIPNNLQTPVTSLSALGRTLSQPYLFTAVLFTVLFLGGVWVVYTYIAALLEARLHLGRDGISVMLVIFGIGAIVGNIIGGRLTDRIGPTTTLKILCLCQIGLLPLLTLVPLGLVATAILLFIWSVCGWSFMVPQQARLALLNPALTPILFSLNAAAIYVAAALGGWAGAQVLDTSVAFSLGPAGATVVLLAFFSLPVAQRLKTRAKTSA